MAAKKRASSKKLTASEKALSDRLNQLSPAERKIQREANLKKIGQKQIDIRNTKAQAYLDKKAAQKAPSVAARAGRASAQAERAVRTALQSPAAARAGQLAKGVGAVGRVAAPVVEGVRAVRYLTDEDYREQAARDYEDMADGNAFMRAVEGGLGGVTTIAAAAENLKEAREASKRAGESGRAADAKTEELIARGILDQSGRTIPIDQRRAGAAAPAAPAAAKPSITTNVSGRRRAANKPKPKPEPEPNLANRADVKSINARRQAANARNPEPEPNLANRADVKSINARRQAANARKQAEERPRVERMESARPPAPAPAPVPEQAGPPRSLMNPEQAGPPRSLMNPEQAGSAVPKAVAPDPAEMQKLFKTVMGSSFDPNSRMDKRKMQEMQDFYTTSGGMAGRSPTRFALDYYKTL
jgi:hypothetical protein